jgi:branched-chain amino acid transport system permease protein
MAVFTVMYAGLASSWNLLGGFSGYLSLGHAAFFGIGAYAIGILFTHVGVGAGYRPFLILPAVGLAVALLSVPVGWVAVRVRAATFAIVTISLLFVVQQLAFNLHGLTHGSQGLALPFPRFPTATFERPFYWAMLAVFALAVLACWYVRGSKLGLMLHAVRDDEDRARGVGIDVTTAKVIAFAVSVGLTAMLGGIWGYYIAFIYPQFAVDPLVTIGAVLMAFLGGKGTIWGPALGAFILVPVQQYLAYKLGASQLYLVGYASVFLAIMLLVPRGILPSLQDRLGRRRADPRGRGAADAEAGSRAEQVTA